MMTKLSCKVLPVLAVLFFSLSSTAAIIPTLVGDEPTDNLDGTFTYTYSVTLTDDSRLDSNSRWAQFFSIFDFAGYIPGSATTSNPDFVFSSANVGVYNSQGAPVEQDGDAGDIPNLTFTYKPCGGPPEALCDVTTPPAGEVIGQQELGIFTADSIFGQTKLDVFQGQDTKNTDGNDDGQRGINEGAILVPTGVIPEPATYALLGGGFLLLSFARKRMVTR